MIIARKRPIGVFDSGVGGLTVLKELQRHFPYEDFIYYADTLNIPYGNKTVEQVTFYSDIAVSWMITHYNVKAVVVACHTSSACCGVWLQEKYEIPIIDTIQATVEAVIDNAPSSLLLLTTERTAKSKIHKQALINAGYSGSILLQACPEFVPCIEQGIIEGPAIEQYITMYCVSHSTKTIVYGCTHYPFLEKSIKKVLGSDVVFINPALYIVNQLKNNVQISIENNTKGVVFFYATKDHSRFMASMNTLFNPLRL